MKKRRKNKRAKKSADSAYVKPTYVAASLGYVAPAYSPLPKMMVSRLRYMEKDIAVNPTVGGLAADYVFRLNSLFDPNLTGTGHQPVGFDQLMVLYKYYTVLRARAHVAFQNTDASNEALVCAHVNNTSTAITDIRTCVENGRTAYQLLTKTGGSRDISNVFISADVAKELGVKNIRDDDLLRGTSTSDPSRQLYLHVVGQPNSTADSAVIGLTVIIEFEALFTDLNTAPLS